MKAFRLFCFMALLLACLGLAATARPGSAYDPSVATYTWDSSVPNFSSAATVHAGTIDTTSLVMADYLGKANGQPYAGSYGDSGAIVGWDDFGTLMSAGDANTNGDWLDGKFLQIQSPEEGWWDLGADADRVVVFTSQDHGPYPAEGLEYSVYGCGTLWNTASCGALGTLTDVYLDGWRDQLTLPCVDSPPNGWCSDDISAVYDLNGIYRYIKLVAWGGGTYTEPEIDAVAPSSTYVDKVIAALWAHITGATAGPVPPLPQWFDMPGWPPNTIGPYPSASPSASVRWPPITPTPGRKQVVWGAPGAVPLFTDELDWSSASVAVTKTAFLWGWAIGSEPACWVATDAIPPLTPGPAVQTVQEAEPAGWSNLTVPLEWRISLPTGFYTCYAYYHVVKVPKDPNVVFIEPAEATLWFWEPLLFCSDRDTLNCPGTPPCPDGFADPQAADANPDCGPPDNSPDTYNPDQGPVGGIVELQTSGSGSAVDSAGSSGGSSPPPYAAIAGGIAAALVAVTAGGWYARRRWLR